MAFYVFDLDGTLADCSHRLHHLESKDWRAFFAACSEDEPIRHTIELLRQLFHAGNVVAIWTGRSDEVREETVTWLHCYGVPTDFIQVRMRIAGDHRPDHAVKLEFLQHDPRRPDIIFEDRGRMVEAWRAEGIPCFQVAPGAY